VENDRNCWLLLLGIYLACGVVRLVWCMKIDGTTLADVLEDAKQEYWPFETENVANSHAAIGLILGIVLWPYMIWISNQD
jgi:hypothetical protein